MSLELEKKSVWKHIDEKEYKEIYAYGERYKEFLDKGKTERECCNEIIKTAVANGYESLEKVIKSGNIKTGKKIYLNHKNKSCVMMILGEDLEQGMNILGSHIDCPRLDLKQVPLYEDGEMALLKTHYYGGVKKYQWTCIPISLHGYVRTRDGKEINMVIGEKDEDPVFFINDLLIHLSADQMKKSMAEGVTGEQLNIVVGHSSYGMDDDEKNPVKSNILKHLFDNYGIKEEDFLVAEFEAVPADKARDVGFDRSMIAAHGHDDRVCAFASLEAILKTENPKRTSVALFVDKEEIGSVGNTSMHSKFFENMVAELLHATGKSGDIYLRRAMANSQVISADVSVAFDPTFPEVLEKNNGARLGYGVSMSKYTGARGKGGCNDANSEFLCELRDRLDKENVIWQTGELGKIDQGGGGTIAYILAAHGAEVVDMGTAMLSMHGPLELLSKADAYMTSKAYWAFLK